MESVFSGVMSVRHLSMPNSNTTRYLRLGLLMVGWLVIIEFILRIPPLQSRLDYYAGQPLWYSTYVPQRIDLIHQNPDADIWLIGSSVAIWGANPALIDPVVNQHTVTAHHSLNVALFGMTNLNDLEDYLTTAFLPAGQPKVMVLGIFPYLFAYTTKDYFKYPKVFEETRDHSRDFDRQVSWWLYERLATFRLIYSINNLVAETPGDHASSDPTGFIRDNTNMGTRQVLEPSGDTNDHLEMNLTLLKGLQQRLQQRNIQLYLINFPVYTPVIEQYPGGPNNFQAYVNRLDEFSKSLSMPFLDLQQAIMDANNNQLPEAYFKDYYHLNNTGATAIAPFIADFVAHNLDPVAK
jgi:hypothetical protein